MPVALALMFGVAVLAVFLIGMLWALAFLLSFYAYIGAAIYLIWRTKRREAELLESMEREAKRQRFFNEQEMRAWRDTIKKEPPNAFGQESSLRSFDGPAIRRRSKAISFGKLLLSDSVGTSHEVAYRIPGARGKP